MSGHGREPVSVIIATLGRPERTDLLEAAIASVVDQDEVAAVPIVVLNGTVATEPVERRLRTDSRIRFLRRPDGNLPAALQAGAEAVDTPYFSALDDDDLLLPGALAARVRVLERDGTDVVVTNGYREYDGVRHLHVSPSTPVADAPLLTLMEANWLLPGSWLCRTDRARALFDGMPKYLECTYLAARFGLDFTMSWLDEPTVVYRLGSPSAESQSRDYVLGQPAALGRILELDLPGDVRKVVERKVAEACHAASEREWRAGRLRGAWRWHARSLRARGGWRYLPYSRHLLTGGSRG